MNDPISGVTTTSCDGNGNVLSVVDALGAETTRNYDAINRLERIVDANLGETAFSYDVMNNLDSVSDPEGQTTTFTFDLLNRRLSATNANLETRSFGYDSRDFLTSVVDAKGQEVFRVYDALGRLTTVELRPGAGALAEDVITLAYDPAGNLLAANDNDSDLAFSYDAVNRRLTVATGPLGLQPEVTLTNLYNLLGERVGLTDSLGGITAYGYDAAGRLLSVEIDPARSLALAYDGAGRLEEIAYPNGVVGSATYDARGRLQDLSHSLGGSDLVDLAYGYDALGQVTSLGEAGQTTNYSYDPERQLTAAGAPGSPENYGYDLAGNRITSHLSTSHSHDAANRLLEDDQACYTVDANGNRTSKTEKIAGACTGPETTYSYDILNRLIRVDLPGGAVANCAYDALSRRIQKDVDGTVTTYLYDGEDIALEFDGLGALQARYRYGPLRDQPLAVERGGQHYYFHGDHLGSVRQLSDETGALVNSYERDAFGRRLSVIETVPQPFGFTGREFDAESGLLHYRARAYDPTSGKFLQDDPIGFAAGDLNLSRYVNNNPANFRDPSGLFAMFLPAIPPALTALGNAAIFVGTAITGAIVLNEAVDDSESEDDADEDSAALSCLLTQNNDDCYEREEEERDRCFGLHRAGILADLHSCLARASTRRDLCVRTGGRPDPNEPDERNPDLDEEYWKNYDR